MKSLYLRIKSVVSRFLNGSEEESVPDAGPVNKKPRTAKPEKAIEQHVDTVAPRQAKRPQKTPRKKWAIDEFVVEPMDGKTRFHDFDLPVPIMHAIADLKFEYCTPVQANLLGKTLKGKDGTAKAQTGTGKSAGFIITILSRFMDKQRRIKPQKGSPRALILAPTRELVNQIEKDFRQLAKYTPIRILSLFGGLGYKQQQADLKDRVIDVVVATPGRLIDFMYQKKISLKQIEILVLDEADRMLDMGFIPDVRKIVYATPHKQHRQTLFFSATLTDEVLRLAKSWTQEDAVMVDIEPEQVTAKSIEQLIYITTETDRFKNVFNLIDQEQLKRVIMFVNRKDTANRVSEKLERYGINSGVLSGDVSQNKRFRVLEDFKRGKVAVLVATDVAARGLHIENISHVINYDLPYEPEHYVHRIGRTGRAGAKGISVSFADEESSFHIPNIEAVLGHSLNCEYPPESLSRALPEPKFRQKEKKSSLQRRPRGKSYKGKPRRPAGGNKRYAGSQGKRPPMKKQAGEKKPTGSKKPSRE